MSKLVFQMLRKFLNGVSEMFTVLNRRFRLLLFPPHHPKFYRINKQLVNWTNISNTSTLKYIELVLLNTFQFHYLSLYFSVSAYDTLK